MLTERDFQVAAAELGCSVAAIKAVAEVESSGAGTLPSGEPKILFESHIFSRLTGHRYDRSHPTISSRAWNRALYKGGKAEHARLAQAVALDRNAALQAASFGAFQILGVNWSRCGYASLQAFINDAYAGDAGQLRMFVGFVKGAGLADELQRLDWTGLARVYNGANFAINKYDVKLAAAYRRHSKEAA